LQGFRGQKLGVVVLSFPNRKGFSTDVSLRFHHQGAKQNTQTEARTAQRRENQKGCGNNDSCPEPADKEVAIRHRGQEKFVQNDNMIENFIRLL
jgi:hypothetical protein